MLEFNTHTVGVLKEVENERYRQDGKWGEQSHPDGTGLLVYKVLAQEARASCDRNFGRGEGTWADILTEEFYEAMQEQHPARLREELIQVAAVATAWVEALDRREAKDAGKN